MFLSMSLKTRRKYSKVLSMFFFMVRNYRQLILSLLIFSTLSVKIFFIVATNKYLFNKSLKCNSNKTSWEIYACKGQETDHSRD